MKTLLKRVLCLTMIVLLALSALPETASAARIRLSKTSATLKAGTTLQLTLKNAEKKVSWRSSRKSVATVNSKGLVTAVKKGSATITATSGGKKYTCKITVTDPPVITASATKVTLSTGQSQTLTVTSTLANISITYSNSNASVADISVGVFDKEKKTVSLTIVAKHPGTSEIVIANDKTLDTIEIKVTVKGQGKLKELQTLYGKTIAQANELLSDTLTKKDKENYVSPYFGVRINSVKNISYIALNKKSDYRLFSVTPGMSWEAAVSALKSYPGYNWTREADNGKAMQFKSEQYPNRYVILSPMNEPVSLIVYAIRTK